GYSSTFGELLNVDNGDFLFSAIVVNGSCIFKIVYQILPRVYLFYLQASFAKLIRRLNHQVQTVYDEIEFRDNALLSIIIGKMFYIIKSQCRFTRSLRMPNDSFALSVV